MKNRNYRELMSIMKYYKSFIWNVSFISFGVSHLKLHQLFISNRENGREKKV